MASIEKRTRDGQERWIIRWRDPITGEQRTESHTSEAEAKRRRSHIEASIDTGKYVDPRRSKLTVGQWIDAWLAARTDLAPKTRERYEGIIHRHIGPRWGKVRLAAVRHADVQRWLSGLDLAPASVRKVHRVLSMTLDYAVKDGRLAVNHAAGVNLPRVQEPEKRFLTHAQVAELADACGSEYRLAVLFLAYTGMRWGEMAALRVRRIDFLTRRVLIAESVTPVHGTMVFGPTKGHQRRVVPLPPFLAEELMQHVAGKARDDLVFTGARGAVMRTGTFRRGALIEAAKSIDIPGFHPHELRHTYASLAIASGADVKQIQNALGHKSAVMTLDQYGHMFGDRLDVVADAMESARTAAMAPKVQQNVVQLRR
jgi:integrase